MQILLFILINIIILVLAKVKIYCLCQELVPDKIKKSQFFGKIVGGNPVPVESYPFTVQFFNFGSLCSGTILNSLTILTSAHCLDLNKDVHEMRIQTGSRYVYDFDSQMHKVVAVAIHSDYNKEVQFANDIALVFVDKPIQLGVKSQKAVLVDTDKWMNRSNKNFIVTGWGWTQYGGPVSELGLMMTWLKYVPRDECGRLHQLNLTRDMFCLYGDGIRDTCKGDSGGGVIWNERLVGITSHGDGCAEKDKPSVYTNVYFFRDWIKSQVDQFLLNYCKQQEKKSRQIIK